MSLIIANWKMNGSKSLLDEGMACWKNDINHNQLVLCAPATLLDYAHQKYPLLSIGAQDCYFYESGAYTGNLSVHHLKEVGASYVIVGHSERRQYHYETNDLINKKAKLALKVGLTPIICIGESETCREKGETLSYLSNQLQECVAELPSDFIIAYEPLWAIGTGRTATLQEIEEVHSFLKSQLPATSLLYGGSVTDQNIADILKCSYVDGVLVGGASLNVSSFSKLLKNACV